MHHRLQSIWWWKKTELKINLKYSRNSNKHYRKVSKPGKNFSSAESLPKINNGLGIAIVSTPKGVMTDIEAKKIK